MPTYMKIDKVPGPITYEHTKGWIELRNVETRRKVVSAGEEPGGGSGIVMKEPDKYSSQLVQLHPQASMVDVTIVFFDAKTPDEVTRITLSDALLAKYRLGPKLDTFTFSADQVSILEGSPAHASRMVQPQDWGSIQAAKVFSQSGQA